MIFIIPARKGSKGLPFKNKKLLCGKPLIEYSIDVALNFPGNKLVIVSTDDEDIYKLSIDKGCFDVGLRPAILATDSSKAIDTYKYIIKLIEDLKFELNLKEICILQPTSPLRNLKDVLNAYEIFRNKDADSVISYSKESHPIFWHKYITSDNKFINIFDDNFENRQTNKETFYPNGSIYIFKKEILLSGKYYTENSFAYKMPPHRSIDIDYQEDFDYAEYLLEKKYEKIY